MNKIDKRRHYVLMIDTETANTMKCPLVYDIGYTIADTRGNVYRTRSYIVSEIFFGERNLMQTAYYANKITRYMEDIKAGKRQANYFEGIRHTLLNDMAEYGIKEVVAHNARFDINALNNTRRWLSKSRYRYFFPYGTEVWCTQIMAYSVIYKMPTFKKFCYEHDFCTPKTLRPKVTAEVLYRFITKNPDFVESHTGLEDTLIETQILKYCYRQHKKMKKVLYAGKSV